MSATTTLEALCAMVDAVTEGDDDKLAAATVDALDVINREMRETAKPRSVSGYQIKGAGSDAYVVDAAGNDVVETVRLGAEYAVKFAGDEIMQIICAGLNATAKPAARYFRDGETIWRFRGGEAHVRCERYGPQWTGSVCGIEDMDTEPEISAEEGEP